MVYQGIRASTQVAYSTAQRTYVNFCRTYNFQPLPIHKDIILLFVTHMHEQKLAPSTINVYLAGVRSLQVKAGYSDPELRTPQVKLALKAIQAVSDPPRQKSPIDFCGARGIPFLHRLVVVCHSNYI